MAQNTGKLSGCTIFITGGSRGIGEAIALKAARDGANVVIAAKTAEPNPKLPGTVYTVAKKIEELGGRCLPCVVDIRYEDQIQKAVDQAVEKFGGIDILVNNASAIHLTGTVQTPMKRYDLMHNINTRGTFLCSKICAPHLKRGRNPHIINISPPLSMKPKWFKDNVAYTMAKYGMSMCALGMAEEFRADGIAVNTLWPQTAIYTAAMVMLGGGDEVKDSCRKPDIMADAAYIMMCKDSRSFTGNFCIDEKVVRDSGVTDLDQYSYVKGAVLTTDFFLDDDDDDKPLVEIPAQKSWNSEAQKTTCRDTFQRIKLLLNPDLVKSINGVFQFDLTGAEAGRWFIDLKNGRGSVGQGQSIFPVQCSLTMDSGDFVKMFAGELKPTAAFSAGKLKIKGNMTLAMKLEKLMGLTHSKM